MRTRTMKRAGLSAGAVIATGVLALTFVAPGIDIAGASLRTHEHARIHHSHDARGLHGRVSAVSSTLLTISKDGRSTSVVLDANTVFLKNGLAIPASDITVGSKVNVTLSTTTITSPNPTASSVALLASAEIKMGHGVEGTVSSVTPTQIVITHDGQSMSFALDATTAYLMNGMAATWANITSGAKVRVVASSTLNTAAVVKIFANESEHAHAVKGTVTAYTPGASLTVSGPHGPVTFLINPATMIAKDHVVLLASDITVGSIVRVTPTATPTPLTAGIIELSGE